MSESTTLIANVERIFPINEDQKEYFQSLIKLLGVKTDRAYWALKQCLDELDFDFYHDLLPKICQWASDHSQAKSVQLLQAGKDASIVYTAEQIRYILANAFFLNTKAGYGSIDLLRLYQSYDDYVAVSRIRCLIEYFRLCTMENDQQREISIERYSANDQLPDWIQMNISIQSAKINVFTDRMENAKEVQGFVDFANKHIHIHQIIPSATQEEVLCKIIDYQSIILGFVFLVSCCPEAFVSILLCETLRDDEIVILRGCKRYIDYSGYLDTFTYKGHYPQDSSSTIQDILVLDACYSNHFTKRNIDRDLGKAWLAFAKSRDRTIVTGNWGCGVFGGDPIFKFLQQICAVMILGDDFQRLDYSVYGNENLALKLKQICIDLEKKTKTVSDLYKMMIEYPRKSSFSNYVDHWLDNQA